MDGASISGVVLPPLRLPGADIRRRGLALPAGVGRRGVYRLRYHDGRHYQGSTENIVVRVGGHARTDDAISHVDLWPFAEGRLQQALVDLQRHVGWGDVRPGSRLRGGGDVDTSEILDSAFARHLWIDRYLPGHQSVRPPETVDQRGRTRPKFEALADHASFAELVGVLRTYVERVIPAPRATEWRNWVITSMPSTARTTVWRRLVCLSVNNVEALTIGEQHDGERWTVAGFMSSAMPRVAGGLALPEAAIERGAFVAPAHYRTVGDVAQIGFDSLAALGPLLDDDLVLDHVGDLILRLMRRGRGLYCRFHDYNLADAVLDD